MKHHITVNNDYQKEHAIKVVKSIPDGVTHEVIVQEYKENRSAAQRRLQWLWNTETGNHMGLMKDAMHFYFKEKFAVPIFIRDDQGYAEMVEAVKAVRRTGQNDKADSIKKKIVELTSTSDFKVKQMSEYLNEIEMYAAEIGATITFPPDVYEKAMKRELPKS